MAWQSQILRWIWFLVPVPKFFRFPFRFIKTLVQNVEHFFICTCFFLFSSATMALAVFSKVRVRLPLIYKSVLTLKSFLLAFLKFHLVRALILFMKSLGCVYKDNTMVTTSSCLVDYVSLSTLNVYEVDVVRSV